MTERDVSLVKQLAAIENEAGKLIGPVGEAKAEVRKVLFVMKDDAGTIHTRTRAAIYRLMDLTEKLTIATYAAGGIEREDLAQRMRDVADGLDMPQTLLRRAAAELVWGEEDDGQV